MKGLGRGAGMHIPNKDDRSAQLSLVIRQVSGAQESAGGRIAWRQCEVTDSARPQPCCPNYLLIQPSVPVSSSTSRSSDQCCEPGHRCAVSHLITHKPHPVSSLSGLGLLLVDSNFAKNLVVVSCDINACVEELLQTECITSELEG